MRSLLIAVLALCACDVDAGFDCHQFCRSATCLGDWLKVDVCMDYCECNAATYRVDILSAYSECGEFKGCPDIEKCIDDHNITERSVDDTWREACYTYKGRCDAMYMDCDASVPWRSDETTVRVQATCFDLSCDEVWSCMVDTIPDEC